VVLSVIHHRQNLLDSDFDTVDKECVSSLELWILKQQRGICWLMREINCIQEMELDFDLQTSVGLDVPIITGTSHFFQTSSPWPGITGMQFPVNNIPRQQRVLLPENSSSLPFRSALPGVSLAAFPVAYLQH
jgi:hypothetical protein